MHAFETEGCVQKERTKTGASLKNKETGEKEERCVAKQNLSSSLSSAITVETSLFLFFVSPSLSSSLSST